MSTTEDFIAALESQLGVPYVFGGSDPSVGFDCSGLVMWAAEQCGVAVARTTQGEWNTLPSGDGSRGDLVEFDVPSDGPPQPQHVGVCLGDGTMINAPHTGTVVQIDPIPNFPGSISVMGYRRIPFHPAPPPPPPPPEVAAMPVSPVFSYRANQRDVFQVSANALWHKWEIGSKWYNENVGFVAGVGPVQFPNQVPQVTILGGQCLVTVEDSTGHVYYFAQGVSGPWGVNELP